ncbi:MAG: Globin-like protein [Adhaeribacter sp.]|jgi:hemoglobin|nr:Globin-like protein [Adhaeribacter sp.]
MHQPKNDIASPQDIQILVDTFYQKIISQPYLLSLFEKLSQRDWSQHLFQMNKFWNSVLLKSQAYKGHPLILHAFLPAQQAQVQEWIHLFHEAVEEHYNGPTATAAKTFAEKMVRIFAYKPAQL